MSRHLPFRLLAITVVTAVSLSTGLIAAAQPPPAPSLAARMYGTVVVESMPNWRDRATLEIRMGVLLAYREEHPDAALSDLLAKGREFDKALKDLSNSPTAEAIRNENNWKLFIGDAAGNTPKFGWIADIATKYRERFVSPEDERIAALGDQLMADKAAAATIDQSSIRGTGETAAELYLAAQNDPDLMAATQIWLGSSAPNPDATPGQMLAASPALRTLDALGLLKIDTENIQQQVSDLKEYTADTLQDVLLVGTEIRANTNKMLEKQGELLDYLKDQQRQADIKNASRVRYESKIAAAQGAVYMASYLAGLHDPTAGRAIQGVGSAVIQTVQAFGRYQDTVTALAQGAKALETSVSTTDRFIGAIALGGDLFGIATSLISVLAGLNAKDPMMETLNALIVQLQAFHDEMATRFEQVEEGLASIHQDMLDQFASVLKGIGDVSESVRATHERLLEIGNRLDQLERGQYDGAVEGKRDQIGAALDRAVSEPGQSAFNYDRFLDSESTLWRAAHDFSTHSPAVLPDVSPSDFQLRDTLSILAKSPTGGNLPFLANTVPRKLGVPPLGGNADLNPSLWSLSASAWAELVATWPQYASKAPGLSTRGSSLVAQATSFNRFIAALGTSGQGDVLFSKLFDRYEQEWTDFSTVADKARDDESTLKQRNGLTAKIDLFGGPDQTIPKDLWPILDRVPFCDAKGEWASNVDSNGLMPGVLALTDAMRGRLGDTVGPAAVSMCLTPTWVDPAYHYKIARDIFGTAQYTLIGGTAIISGTMSLKVGDKTVYEYELTRSMMPRTGYCSIIRSGFNKDDAGCASHSLDPWKVMAHLNLVDVLSAARDGLAKSSVSGQRMDWVRAVIGSQLAAMRREVYDKLAYDLRYGKLVSVASETSAIGALVSAYGWLAFRPTVEVDDLLASVLVGSNRLLVEDPGADLSSFLSQPGLEGYGSNQAQALKSLALDRAKLVQDIIDSCYEPAIRCGQQSLSEIAASADRIQAAIETTDAYAATNSPIAHLRQALQRGDVKSSIDQLASVGPIFSEQERSSLQDAASTGAATSFQAMISKWRTGSTPDETAALRMAVATDVLSTLLGATQSSGATAWAEEVERK